MASYFQCPWPQCPTPFLRHSHADAVRHIAWAKAAGVWMCPWQGCPNPYSQDAHTRHQVYAGLAPEPDVELPPPDFVEPGRASVLAAGARPRPFARALPRALVEDESSGTVRNVIGRLHETTPIYDSVVRDLGVDPVCMRLEDGFAKLLSAGIMKPICSLFEKQHNNTTTQR